MIDARPAARVEGRWIIALAVAATLAIVGALRPELRALHLACKPLATLLVAAMVYRAPVAATRYRNAVLAGLLLSTAGDVFLMFEPAPQGPDWFVFGLGAFLLAHLAYLYAFCSRERLLAKAWPYFAYATVALVVGAQLTPHLPAALRWPVYAYVLVLSAMAAQAASVWAVRRDASSCAAALGGAFFVVSDATLAWDRFVAPFPAAVVVVLATYWIAQALIGLSATRSAAR